MQRGREYGTCPHWRATRKHGCPHGLGPLCTSLRGLLLPQSLHRTPQRCNGHTAHRAGVQWAVRQGGSRDEDVSPLPACSEHRVRDEHGACGLRGPYVYVGRTWAQSDCYSSQRPLCGYVDLARPYRQWVGSSQPLDDLERRQRSFAVVECTFPRSSAGACAVGFGGRAVSAVGPEPESVVRFEKSGSWL